MKRYGFTHIHTWLWFFLIIALLANIGIFLLVFNEISGAAAALQIHHEAPEPATDTASGIYPVAELKTRILLILIIGLLVLAMLAVSWLHLFSRRIHRPIHLIQQTVARMAQGKLNETVTINGIDDLARIGGGLNELAANLQELLLYIWKQTGQCQHGVSDIHAALERLEGPDREAAALRESVRELAAAIDNLRGIAKAYVFYDVRLEGDQALAINLQASDSSHPTAAN